MLTTEQARVVAAGWSATKLLLVVWFASRLWPDDWRTSVAVAEQQRRRGR